MSYEGPVTLTKPRALSIGQRANGDYVIAFGSEVWAEFQASDEARRRGGASDLIRKVAIGALAPRATGEEQLGVVAAINPDWIYSGDSLDEGEKPHGVCLRFPKDRIAAAAGLFGVSDVECMSDIQRMLVELWNFVSAGGVFGS